MAQLNDQTVTITLSELVKNGEDVSPLLSNDIIAQLEDIISQLVGEDRNVLIEIE